MDIFQFVTCRTSLIQTSLSFMWTWIYLRCMLHWPNMVLWTLMPNTKWAQFHKNLFLNGVPFIYVVIVRIEISLECAPQKCMGKSSGHSLVSKTKLWKLLKHLKSRNFIKVSLGKIYRLSLSWQKICRWNFNGSLGRGKMAISSHYSGTIQAFSELHLCGLT